MNLPGGLKSRLSLLALAAIPLAVKAPYLWRAWTSSPIDHDHLKFYGTLSLAAVIVAVALLRRLRVPAKPHSPILPAMALVVALGLFAFGVVREVNAIQLISGVGILWATGWLLFGHFAAGVFAPAAVFAILAVPGTLYWMRNATTTIASAPCEPFAPTFSPDSQAGMLGREMPPSPDVLRLFRTGTARQFIYASPSNCVTVLAVAVGDDIHEIHPATHCMRSGGWKVLSERLLRTRHPMGGELEVDEAVAESFDGRMLVWIWYSSDEASTGSFLQFRRLYSAKSRWHTYQMATALGDAPDAVQSARERLRQFLLTGDGK